jgi:tetratricopeptide (TPR) repeat protein
MTPDRWKDVERLYHAARAEAPEARPAFLAKACGGDEELQRELHSLLAHASAAGVLDLVHDRVSERTNDPTRTGIEGPRLTRALAAIPTSAEAFVRPAIPEGSVLAGRYQVERRLGQGGMGAVYRVRDTIHPDRPTALKILGTARPDREALRRFRAEFGLLAQLSHPNLTPVYDFDAQDEAGLCFFTMEHVDGVDLESALGGASWRDVLEPIVAVCRALAFIHSRRIIHFDVKPSNIMVTANGTTKVLDFGIAELVQAVGGLDLCGTPGFIAPELLQGSAAVDRRADLYSLGITLYRLLYGRMPNASATLGLECDSGQGVALAVDDRVPSWLNAIVLRLTDPSPAARFSGANAVIDAINAGSGLQFALQTDETRQSYVLSSAFVGRGTELDRLRSFVRRRVVEEAVDFGGICVVGDAGTGKSRILRELKLRVQFAGLAFVECDCYETDEAELGPLGEALRQLVYLLEGVGAADLLQAYGPDLVRVDPSIDPGRRWPAALPGRSPAGERERLLDRCAGFLVAAAGRVPFVLSVGDLQWARPALLEVLRRLVGELSSTPVRMAVVGTAREARAESGLPAPGHRFLELAEAEGHLELLRLGTLSRGEVASLAASMLGVDEVPAVLSDRLHGATSGRPFFVEEVLRALVERGVATVETGATMGDVELGQLRIPDSVDEVIAERVLALPSSSMAVLTAAAVATRPVMGGLLQAVVEQSDEAFEASARLLISRQFMRRDVIDGYRISHDRMREWVYARIPEAECRALHVRVLRALEATHLTDDDTLYASAHHAWHGRDPRARSLNAEAATRAQARYSTDLAMVCYERALALTDEAAEPAFAMTLHERLADVAFLSASYSRALKGYEQALRLAQGVGDEVRLGRRIGDTLSKTGRLAQADDILRRAIRRAGRRVINPGLALPVLLQCDDLPWRLLSRLPRTFGPATVGARALAGEVGRAYTSLGLLNLFVCDAKARGFLYRGMNLAARCRDDALLCETLIHRIWTCLTQTDFKGAHANLCDARAAASRTGSRYLLALCSATEVRILVRQGAWARTAELARHVVTELEDIGELHLRALTCAHLGFALLHLGDTLRARVWCERALALFARGPGTHHEILPAVSGCAEVLAVAGEFDEARKQLKAITEYLGSLVTETGDVYYPHLAEIFLRLGRGRCAVYAHDWEVAERELDALAAVPRFMHYTDAGPEITEGRLLLDRVRLRLHKPVRSSPRARIGFTLVRRGQLGAGTRRFYPAFQGMAMIIGAERDAAAGRTERASRVFRRVLADAERSADRLLLARALLAAGEALGSSMPGEARSWHDRGIALSQEIGAVALVRAHQVG